MNFEYKGLARSLNIKVYILYAFSVSSMAMGWVINVNPMFKPRVLLLAAGFTVSSMGGKEAKAAGKLDVMDGVSLESTVNKDIITMVDLVEPNQESDVCHTQHKSFGMCFGLWMSVKPQQGDV